MSYTKQLSASRGAAILGVSKWQTTLEAYLNMKNDEDPNWCANHGYISPSPVEYSASMKFGHCFESSICELVSQNRGAEFIDREKFYRHPVYDFLTCHIDGRCNGILQENKTVYQRAFYSWGEPETDKIPTEYMIQVHHQMLVTGENKVELNALVLPKSPDEWEAMGWFVDKCEFAPNDYAIGGMWNNDPEVIDPYSWALPLAQMGFFHRYIIHRNEELMQLMTDLYLKFWDNYQNDIIPDPANYDDVRLLIKDPCGIVVLNEDQERLIYEYNDIRDEIKSGGRLASRQDEIKLDILNIARSTIANMDEDLKNESRDKIIFMNQSGKKLKSYSLKGGFR